MFKQRLVHLNILLLQLVLIDLLVDYHAVLILVLLLVLDLLLPLTLSILALNDLVVTDDCGDHCALFVLVNMQPFHLRYVS